MDDGEIRDVVDDNSNGLGPPRDRIGWQAQGRVRTTPAQEFLDDVVIGQGRITPGKIQIAV